MAKDNNGDRQKRDTPKGFAGMSSLLSNVDESLPNLDNKPQQTSEESAQPRLDTVPERRVYQQPTKPKSSESSTGKWGLGIIGIIGALWIFDLMDEKKVPERAPYPPVEQDTSLNYPTTPDKPTSVRPEQLVPPVGQNLVLSIPQIRYCVAENIRIDGAKSTINNYIDADVYRFNNMVADYNSRCGNFRYYEGNLQAAERDMEQYRYELFSEGASRFTPSQNKPPEVGVGSGAALAPLFQESVDANPSTSNLDLSGLTTKPSTANSQVAVTEPASPDDTYNEQLAIHKACESSLLHSGQQNYEWCVERESADLKSSGGPPDMSEFTKLERAIIENACSSERQYTGPSTYYDCLRKEVKNVAFR